MNEDTQLKAMAAELTSAGYTVATNVPGDRLKAGIAPLASLEGLDLDIVAEIAVRDEKGAERSDLLIIEVANRRRRGGGRPGSRSLPRYVEDEKALWRFETISSALAALPGAELQIRFFDVSADQSNARYVQGPLKNKEAMLARLAEDTTALDRIGFEGNLAAGLVAARLWASWLRIIGNLHPGRERRELKAADLRTIHKDLYDQKIVDLPPDRYASTHRSLLAAFEGGDVDLPALLELAPQVSRLMKWAEQSYGAPPRKMSDQDRLIEDIARSILERAEGGRRDELMYVAEELMFFQNTSSFPTIVARFLLTLGRDTFVSDDLVNELLRRAATSPA
ncbi:hypothetical protein [Sphingomonas sp. BK069]|uniref:hypothetical protein n=1 Tax=Sphingomonas sp. BK069 TaxID=2586979 RepID=UPI0016181AC8|nr:hypothetical protein [Sphingomonas sp. BK069]MBB3348351.1 hypothetical protein [Sphingomonas sp. BK069]